MHNRIDKEPATLVDLVGVIPGNGSEAGQYVTFGNHRDAWVQGASDPHSGTVVLQGTAYLLGMAYKMGMLLQASCPCFASTFNISSYFRRALWLPQNEESLAFRHGSVLF